jgi:hypothetical protein
VGCDLGVAAALEFLQHHLVEWVTGVSLLHDPHYVSALEMSSLIHAVASAAPATLAKTIIRCLARIGASGRFEQLPKCTTISLSVQSPYSNCSTSQLTGKPAVPSRGLVLADAAPGHARFPQTPSLDRYDAEVRDNACMVKSFRPSDDDPLYKLPVNQILDAMVFFGARSRSCSTKHFSKIVLANPRLAG